MNVVVVAQPRVGIPWPYDIGKIFLLGVQVEWHPFLLNMGEVFQTHHRHWAMVGYNFLCKCLGLQEVDDI